MVRRLHHCPGSPRCSPSSSEHRTSVPSRCAGSHPIASTVALRARSLSIRSSFCAGQMKLIRWPPSRIMSVSCSPSAGCGSGPRTFSTSSALPHRSWMPLHDPRAHLLVGFVRERRLRPRAGLDHDHVAKLLQALDARGRGRHAALLAMHLLRYPYQHGRLVAPFPWFLPAFGVLSGFERSLTEASGSGRACRWRTCAKGRVSGSARRCRCTGAAPVAVRRRTGERSALTASRSTRPGTLPPIEPGYRCVGL